MGTNPEHVASPPETRGEPVTWIGRDRAFERSPEPPAAREARPRFGLSLDASGTNRWKWSLGALAAVLLIALVAWKLLAGGAKPQAALADRGGTPLVSVIVPGAKPVTSSVTFTGAIAARYDMPIANEGDTGRIVAVYVEAGDKVKRGQLLARIDDSVLVQQVHRLEASLEQARAQAALSAAEYRRAEGVASAGALSAEDIEKRRATSVTDAANVKVVAAQLAEAEARLARTHIVAPVEGTVLTRHAEVGQIANPGGDPLFRLESGGEVEMRGQIAEQDLAQVKTGQAATVYLTGIERPFTGQVRLLGAIIDPQTRLGDIRIRLQPDPALRPGAFARAVVDVARTQRPVLPQTAVMADSNGSYVLVVDGTGKVVRRAVRVSGTTDGGVIIAEGLAGTERVVATAGGFLRDGETVNVAPPVSGATPVAGTP
ncbi:MAG: efflux RND transporter periplasmic adaptor subunit [Gammaproteobacteria bacterium]|nr:efflux RND transporter periplasmic adaptor subunit [Gammaproteobacteria bacterium]